MQDRNLWMRDGVGHLPAPGVVLWLFLLAGCWSDEAQYRDSSPRSGEVGILRSGMEGFIQNRGQVDDARVAYYQRTRGMLLGFSESSILLNLKRRLASYGDRSGPRESLKAPLSGDTYESLLVTLRFAGSRRVLPRGRIPSKNRTHYFKGPDPDSWRRDVRSFQILEYVEIYDGIDLVVHASPVGLKYELRLAPGADINDIVLEFDGALDVGIAEGGTIELASAFGDLHDEAPIARAGGNEIPCRFRLMGLCSYGFSVEGWDGSEELVIDPLISSTFVGGASDETPADIEVDVGGNVFLVGSTMSVDFPTTSGVVDRTHNGDYDCFVLKLDPTGAQALFSTFLGGSLDDFGEGLALDGQGRVLVGGSTQSADFPTTSGSFSTSHSGARDAWIARLDSSGSVLQFSTYLGGANDDSVTCLAADALDRAVLGGVTRSSDFPVTPGALDPTLEGDFDGFVARLDLTGSQLEYATYLGGSRQDTIWDIALDASGAAYVVGDTISVDFPTTQGAFQTAPSQGVEGFVSKLDPGGSLLEFSTYLGGGSNDRAFAVVVEPQGAVVVAGETAAIGFPIPSGGFDTIGRGGTDAFVVRLDSTGTALISGTLLGGAAHDSASGVLLRASGEVVVMGTTCSSGFPATPGSFDDKFNGVCDVFVSQLDWGMTTLTYSSFLGGTRADFGTRLAGTGSGSVYICGTTESDDFPFSPGVFDETHNGGSDAFVSNLELPIVPVCPLSQGFWKNHPAAWPVFSLDLGSETYNQAEVLALLKTPPEGDASLILAKQLVAAKLNIESGSDISPVSSDTAEADALFASESEKLPYAVHASTPKGQQMVGLAEHLDEYNKALLTANCTP